jgi:eukaryotic-like serine/threonine-protein kinase
MKFTYSTGQQPLDGYTIKRGIGGGGFGEVYYGLSDGGKEVALKLIRSNVDIELRGMSQCLNFKHPNLVELYDLRTDGDGDHWVVMEYVSGETLHTVLGRHPGGLAPELVRQCFAGLTAAISYLHERGVVHRDLKPGNIFLENGNVKVGDFGLARFISGSQRNALTQSIGTVHYMAPEISTGNYNKQVDIYAAGIILYEMLTGQVPFDGESAGEILMKHLTTPPDLSRVPAEFRRILERALSKDPARRYPSMAEMGREAAALGGVPMARAMPAAARVSYPPIQAACSPRANAACSPKLNGAAPGVCVEPIPTVLPVSGGPRAWVSELVGSMSMAAVVILLLCIVWAALLRTNNLVKIAPCFFLTLACSWAILVPAKMWTTRVNDSWKRRVVLMCMGVLVGVLALWLEGYDMPLLFGAETPTAAPKAAKFVALEGLAKGDADGVSKVTVRHNWYSEGLLVRGQDVPIAACYLAYFGLAFFLIRWWKMADRRRRHRFSFGSVIGAALGCWILMLFVWPGDEQTRVGLIDPTTAITALVMASVVVQLVSPWEAPAPPKARKLRLANA